MDESIEVTGATSWYFIPPWAVWEKEADEDIKEGRYEVFESMDDFIATLDKEVNDGPDAT